MKLHNIRKITDQASASDDYRPGEIVMDADDELFVILLNGGLLPLRDSDGNPITTRRIDRATGYALGPMKKVNLGFDLVTTGDDDYRL